MLILKLFGIGGAVPPQCRGNHKHQKVQNEVQKFFNFKHLRIKRYSTLSVPAVVR